MGEQSTSVTGVIAFFRERIILVGKLVLEYAPEENEYNKSFLYTEVLISLSNYTSTHSPHLEQRIC